MERGKAIAAPTFLGPNSLDPNLLNTGLPNLVGRKEATDRIDNTPGAV
jgi:hypothetical protein